LPIQKPEKFSVSLMEKEEFMISRFGKTVTSSLTETLNVWQIKDIKEFRKITPTVGFLTKKSPVNN
jgi:hypothetical protein